MPSIVPLPIPFMDDVAGTVAEYMTASAGGQPLAVSQSRCTYGCGCGCGAQKRPQQEGEVMATTTMVAPTVC